MKIKRSPENLKALRGALASPALLGSDVHKLSDEEAYEAGERLLDRLVAAAPKIAEAGRKVGEALTEALRAVADFGRTLETQRPAT